MPQEDGKIAKNERNVFQAKTKSLVQKPFSALSYTWGPATPTRIILTDGKELKIRETLWQCLNRLRYRHSPVPIFIDQICVDQGNVLERSHQVSIMGDIYRAASELHVWLGLAADNSDEAMDFMKNPSKDSLTPILEQSLHLLFKRVYWTRLWIVQEIILGPTDKLQLHCGFESVSSAQIHNLYSTIGWDIDLPRTPFDLIASKDLIMDYVRSRQLEVDSINTRSNPEWLDIYHFLGHDCSNFLDKVYGIQGLLDSQFRVPVDYSISADNLFFRLFPIFVSCTIRMVSNPPWTEAPLFDWRNLVTLLRALGRALKVTFLPSVAMDLVVAELEIIGVQIYDQPTKRLKIWPWRSPENPPDLPEFVRLLWSRAIFGWLDDATLEESAPISTAHIWNPPPSYFALQREQKRRRLKLRGPGSAFRKWRLEQGNALKQDAFSDITWTSAESDQDVPFAGNSSGPRPRLF